MNAQHGSRGISRRTALRGTTMLGVAGAVGGAGLLRPPAARATTLDYTTREAFDHVDLGFNNGNGRKDDLNENRGALGWGESYVLQGYLMMYETYGDTYYLDKALDHIDHVLATRDSERGVTDWQGRSLPGWRIGYPYTAGDAILEDAQGRPSLRVRTARAYADDLKVTVSAGTRPGTFRIDTYHFVYEVGGSYDNLTMDPEGADYAVRRINEAFDPSADQLTALDLRPNPEAAGNPAPVTTNARSAYIHSSVHTGQITLPIARFARIVATTPRLRSVRRYRERFPVYVAAATSALAIHDEEYRLGEGGEGHYVYLRGAPVNVDGSDLPHNYNCSMARAYLELASARHRRAHRERAEQLVRTFQRDLLRHANGTTTWTYYWTKGWNYSGWSREDEVSQNFPVRGASTRVEDVSHGHIEVDLTACALRDSVVMTRRDLEGVANTLQRLVYTTDAGGSPTVTRYVDGSGTTGLTAYEMVSAGWLRSALYGDREAIARHAATMFREIQPDPQVLAIFGSAYLNWVTRQ